MKILHIIETLNLGGAERVVADLCNIMVLKHDVTVCCIKDTGVMASRISSSVKIDCLNKGEGNSVRFIFQLARYIKEKKPDIVHLHSLGALLEVAIALSFFSRSTFVVTCHGHLSHYSKNGFKRMLRRLIEIPAFLSVDRIVTVSEELKKIFPRFVSNKVTTIYNGVHVEVKTTDDASNQDVINLIYAGRLAKVKNLGTVIHAIKLIEDQLTVTLRFQIFGGGPEEENLKCLVSDLRVKSEINFIGYVDDVRSYYKNGHIFILPSEYEGISIALLEAMAEALAVIVTNVGGNPEVVEQEISGIIFEYNDISGLADAIEKLAYNDNLRDQLRFNGFERVKTLFNIEVATWRYLQLYQGYEN